MPPDQLFYIGDLLPLLNMNRLAVIGSRRVTTYGKAVTQRLVREVAEQGVVIISGLALGVDSIAHQAALEAGGLTIAVLPAGLDDICPHSHQQLAKRILDQGGALISEYPFGTPPIRPNFVARNRIVSGLSQSVLITEAAVKSGTIHTANFALEQGRSVMAVPGNITSELSSGTNNLIKAGATPVTDASDICATLGIEGSQTTSVRAQNEEEAVILKLLCQGITEGQELLLRSALQVPIFNQTLTMLEITGRIRPLGADRWAIR